MLPSRGRGRGQKVPWRGRGRGRGQISGRQELPQAPGDTHGATAAYSSERSYSELTHSQRPPKDLSETSEQYLYQKDTETQEERYARPVRVRPDDLGIQFKRKLAISGLATRPGEGNLGKRIKLLSNCFQLKVPSGNVYHYDVSIVRKRVNADNEDKNTDLPPDAVKDERRYRCLSTKKNREIITMILETNPLFHELSAAYDGQKNLYTRYPLCADFPMKCEVILPDENAENPQADERRNAFVVQIKPVNKTDSVSCAISLDSLHALYEKRTSSVPQEAIMALETILRHGPCLRFTPIGRSFFKPSDPRDLHPLGGGLEIWFGYHQSLRLGQWGPMVNLDLSATAFYQKGPVLEFIAKCLNTDVRDLRRRPILSALQIKRINNKLKNMRIEVNHLRNYRRKYRILKLVKESANRLEFDLTENGRTVNTTVAAYFRERYNRNLDFPNLPCLQVHPENKKRYLPIEVCDIIEGQHCKRKLEPKQTSEMIKFTATPPKERFLKIKERARTDINSDRFNREFGVEVSRDPLSLEGRVLDPPSLMYKDGDIIKPEGGTWNMRRTQFLRGAEIESWVLVSFTDISEQDLDKFSGLLLQIGKELGISLNSPQLVDIIDPPPCDIEAFLSEMKTTHQATLAIIVVPSSDRSLYGRIKQAAETSVGLITQCIKESNVTNPKKCNPSLVSNLCLKINTKMGGQNNALVRAEIPPVLWKPVIIIGADVNHPGPSRGIKPSLAACVGSLDNKLSRFAVRIRVQPNVDVNKKAVEIILDLKGMVEELLKAFYRYTNRKKPEKIIFYRDGVSEGQFDEVQKKEVRAIREACRALDADYQPGITFIVVQKRHHVRFMPEDPRDGVGSIKNVPPGTTVDTVVTHPENFDYFLCSHSGLKGTSRPGHYTVLEDDNNFTANDIQKLTYQLCHTYARCTRSIKIPVPVAYADLAAYRARQHLEASIEESTTSSDSSDGDGDGSQQLPQSVIEAIKIDADLKNTMYFV